MRATARKIAFPAALLCAVLLLSQCGLPKPYKQLIAPNGVDEGLVLKIEKTTDAGNVEPEFRGFELYYRFYNTYDTPQYADTFEELITSKYRRVNSQTDVYGYASVPPPLIPVDINDRDDIFTLTVDFIDILAPYPKITATETDDAVPVALDVPINIEDIRRGVQNKTDSDEYEHFSEFLSTDADISSLEWSSDFEVQGNLVLYVLSYGWDIEIGDLYSEPVLLGDVTRDFVNP